MLRAGRSPATRPSSLFSLPLIILTLGLFVLVVNAFMLQLTIWVSGTWGSACPRTDSA